MKSIRSLASTNSIIALGFAVALSACSDKKADDAPGSQANPQAAVPNPGDPLLLEGGALHWMVGSWRINEKACPAATEDSCDFYSVYHLFPDRMVEERIERSYRKGDPDVPDGTRCHVRISSRIRLEAAAVANEYQLNYAPQSVTLVPDRRNSDACSVLIDRMNAENAQYAKSDLVHDMRMIRTIMIPRSDRTTVSMDAGSAWYTSNRVPVSANGTTCLNLSGVYASAEDIAKKSQIVVTQKGCEQATISVRSWSDTPNPSDIYGRPQPDKETVTREFKASTQLQSIIDPDGVSFDGTVLLSPAGVEISKATKTGEEIKFEKAGLITLDSMGDLVTLGAPGTAPIKRFRQTIFQKAL